MVSFSQPKWCVASTLQDENASNPTHMKFIFISKCITPDILNKVSISLTIDILCRMCPDRYNIFYKCKALFFQFLHCVPPHFFVHFNDVLPCTQLMGWQNLKIKTTHLGIKYGEHLVWESIIHKNLTDNICIMDSCYKICTFKLVSSSKIKKG